MSAETPTETNQPPPNAVDITTAQDGGVLKEVKKEGTGQASPLAGDEVFVHYVGTLLDGEKFDSSRDRKEQFQFTLGRGKVIKAWDIGVATMRKGELAVFTCKPEYAYGETGAGAKIPPNTTLVFEIELFSWRGEDISPDKDQSILRSRIKDGEGFDHPSDGSLCKIYIVGSYEGRVFEEREVDFPVGEGMTKGVVEGVEEAVKKMNKGEVARLIIKSNYAFGAQGKAEFDIPVGATVQYDVTLESFEKVKESWEMTEDEKLEQAEFYKNKGTTYFKDSNFVLAKSFYEKAIELLKADFDEEKEITEATPEQKFLVLAFLNAAASCLKLSESVKARDYCSNALHIDSRNEKALFRRGSAYMNLAEYNLAIQDFNAVLAIAPGNKAARNQIALANQKKKEIHDKEKKIFAGMFTKFAELDAKKEKKEEVPVATNGTEEKAAAQPMEQES